MDIDRTIIESLFIIKSNEARLVMSYAPAPSAKKETNTVKTLTSYLGYVLVSRNNNCVVNIATFNMK